MEYRSVKGMEDILPPDVQIWQELERIARGALESSGFREIRTPVLEETAVFMRSIGEASDIVTKEMYTFVDKGGRSLTMRPEGTAPIVRSYIEHSLNKKFSENEFRLYYIGPMFRAEQPQKGRLRQFHQIGAEIIGTLDPQADVELIMQLDRMLRGFGLSDFSVKLNSLGCKSDKQKYEKLLKEFFKGEKNRLCDDCKVRLDKNVLRILDCKNESCIAVIKNAPEVAVSLCKECILNFTIVKGCLKGIGVDFLEARHLVRGLDYYTGTVFEITHPGLGGQDALGAGGRYDNLVKEMGGPDAGAVGYAVGLERIILALGEKKEFLKPNIIFFASLGKDAKQKSMLLAEELRRECSASGSIKVVTLLGGLGEASLKSQMRSADRNSAKLVVIIGDDELKRQEATLRDMKTKEQESVGFTKLVEVVKNRIEI